jgi:arylsulfatase A-like enzyme
MPLVIAWKGRIKGGKVINEMVNLIDLAPTFLEAAGLKVPKEMSGKSLLSLLEGKRKENLEKVQFLERERHAYVRPNNLSYPSRAIRTNQFLYIANFQPDRYPSGNPEFIYAVGEYGDCDNSPTKSYILENKDKSEVAQFYRLAFEKRPDEELYDLEKDPSQLNNVVGNPTYAKELDKLRAMLRKWQKQTQDPRYINPHDTRWDSFPYYGGGGKID